MKSKSFYEGERLLSWSDPNHSAFSMPSLNFISIPKVRTGRKGK